MPELQETNINQLQWFFPTTDHGENDGFSDSLLEYFQGDHEKYIAREVIQNAVDARDDYNVPVSVVFERITIPVSSLPGHLEFLDRLKRCLEFVKDQEKAENFFRTAIELMQGENLPVLKISDFNTKGLFGGDNEIGGNWYRLVRAAGTSSLKGVGGGSFGIGKGAPIAASALRTVFYSSINDKDELVCQGKSRLVSHHDDKMDVRQGVGFYGVDGYLAIRDEKLIPELFKRTERGTDIFVMGYKSADDWERKLIKSVLHNCWLAIYRGDLEVTLRDRTELIITKQNLRQLLEEYDAQDAKFFYEAVADDHSSVFEEELRYLGKVTLYVRKGDSYPGKVMMVRKSKMLVREKPYHVLREPYVGVFICENDKGNLLLRELEPPAHDNWDHARAKNGPVVLRELDKFVRQSLKTMASSLTSEPQDIPGLSSYLPDSDDRDYLPSNFGDAFEETDLSTSVESGREVGLEKNFPDAGTSSIIRKSFVTNIQQSLIKKTHHKVPGKGTGGDPTGIEGEGKEGVRIKTSSIVFRSFVQRLDNKLEYYFAITGREDCEGAIRIVAVGDDSSYPVEIESAVDVKSMKHFETGNSTIKGLKIENGKTVKLVVRLTSDKKYALGIETYEG